MATSHRPVPGTGLVVSGPARADVVRAQKEANLPAGQIAPAAKAMLDERRARNTMAQMIRGTQWGINDQQTARAIANYCYENGVDPIRHVEVLGGRIYLTAVYYEEAGAALIAKGDVTRIERDHIEADARLDEAYLEGIRFADDAQKAGQGEEATFWTTEANKARREIARRRILRIKHNVPEKALGAVVVRVWPAEMSEPIEGCNWAGGVRGKHESGKFKDPVGEAEPSKTAETRAARRAWKQLCTVVPSIAPAVLLAEEEGAALEEIIAEGKRLHAGDAEDGDEFRISGPPVEAERVVVETVAPLADPDAIDDRDIAEMDARAAAAAGELPLGGKAAPRGRNALAEP